MRIGSNLRGFIIAFAVAFSLFATFAQPAHSRTNQPNEDLWKVMTYQELMMLSPKHRHQYLNGLREAIVEFEKNQRANGDAFARSQREASSAQFLLWKALIQEVEAKPFDATCPSEFQNRLKQHPRVWNNGLFICMPPRMKSCPAAANKFINVGSYRGRAVCYQIHQAFKDAAQKRHQEQLKKLKTEAQRKKARAAQLRAIAKKHADHLEALARLKPARTKVHASKETKSSGSDVEEPSDPTSGVDGGDPLAPLSAEQVENQKDDVDTDHGAAEAVIAGSHEAIAVVDPAADDEEAPRDNGNDVKLNDHARTIHDERDNLCGPPALDTKTCNNQTIAKARVENYRNKETPHCMMAGNFSHFANQQKKPGNCQTPSDFCFGSLTCHESNGDFRTGAKPVFKCGGKKQVICNPYVFGLDKNQKPLCVERTGHEFTSCNQLATHLEGDSGPNSVALFDMEVDESNPDPQKVKSRNGLIEGWNEFAEEMNEMCFKSPTAEVYCAECQVIKTRLYSLRLTAVQVADKDCNKLINHPRTPKELLPVQQVPASTHTDSVQ